MDNTHLLTGDPTTQISLFVKSLRERGYSGAHQFKGGDIEAHFQNGLLHNTNGPAWHEVTPKMVRLGWCLNGIVRAIEENGRKSIFDPRTGKFEPVREINFAQLGFNSVTSMAATLLVGNPITHVLTPNCLPGRPKLSVVSSIGKKRASAG